MEAFLLFSHLVMSDSLRPRGLQHARLPCPPPSPRICSNSCPLSHNAIEPSHPLSTPCSSAFTLSQHQSFLMSHLFVLGGQSIEASASASVLMNIQDWFPLRLSGLISLQSRGLSRVFNTTVQKHQFFGAQLSLWSTSHIHIWLLEKP